MMGAVTWKAPNVVTWKAPNVERPEGPLTGLERPMLQAFLDWHRATLLYKCAGLTGEEFKLADAAVAHASLDDTFTHRNELMSLRMIYLHMIEEYARHLGHADLLRERIDGATGELATRLAATRRRPASRRAQCRAGRRKPLTDRYRCGVRSRRPRAFRSFVAVTYITRVAEGRLGG